MTLIVKGTIKPSNDENFTWQLEAKDIGISVGSNDDCLDDLFDTLTRLIKTNREEEVGRSVIVDDLGITISAKFRVIPTKNRTLDEFSATLRFPDGKEIPFEKLEGVVDKLAKVAARTGETPEEVLARAQAELERQKFAGVSTSGDAS